MVIWLDFWFGFLGLVCGVVGGGRRGLSWLLGVSGLVLWFDSVVLWWFPDGALWGCLFCCCLLVVIGSINSVVRDTHSGVILVVLWV